MSDSEIRQEQELEKIDLINLLTRYMQVVRHMLFWFVLFMAVFAGLFYLRAKRSYRPVYSASATYSVTVQEESGSGSYGSARYYDNEVAKQIVGTFPYILTSDTLRHRIADELGAGGVSSNIRATVLENTNFLTITVTDYDAERAYNTLEAVLKYYPEISELIIGRVYLNLLDASGIPTTPSNPPSYKSEMVKGAMVGCVLVLIWCLVIAMLRKTILQEKDIFNYLHIRCIGVIPIIVGSRRRSDDERESVTFMNPKFDDQIREPFMQLRNRVQYYNRKHNMKTFLVTSALAGEGKSTIAVNLALSLVEDNKRVMLIDCDIRHPSDCDILGIEQAKGLSEILLGEATVGECLLKGEDLGLPQSKRFVFLPGGKAIADGSKLLGSSRMKNIVKQAADQVDYVILDSAPAGLLTDAVVLSQYAEGAVLVTRKDFANVDYIIEGMERLAESEIKIIGAVLNAV